MTEEANIVRLIYARGFYMLSDFRKGDLFLKAVEKSKNKNKQINMLLEEIKRCKRLYPYRQSEMTNKLILTCKP